MFSIVLSNKKQLILPSTAVERILKEESEKKHLRLSSDLEANVDVDANESSLSEASCTSSDAEIDSCGNESDDNDLEAAHARDGSESIREKNSTPASEEVGERCSCALKL